MKNQLCEIKISYKPKTRITAFPKLKSSEEVFNFIYDYMDEDLIAAREEFLVIYLNRANRVNGVFKAFSGGISATVVDIKLILATALKSLSSSIILIHNHPSGNLKPSQADLSLTRKIRSSCQLLDLELLDHLIISPEREYFSMADELVI